MNNPFRYFNSSPEVIRLAVMMYIRYPLWACHEFRGRMPRRGIVTLTAGFQLLWPSASQADEENRHCQTNLNRPAKGVGLRLSSRQLTPFG